MRHGLYVHYWKGLSSRLDGGKVREIKFRVFNRNGRLLGYEKWSEGTYRPSTAEWIASPVWLYSDDDKRWSPDPPWDGMACRKQLVPPDADCHVNRRLVPKREDFNIGGKMSLETLREKAARAEDAGELLNLLISAIDALEAARREVSEYRTELAAEIADHLGDLRRLGELEKRLEGKAAQGGDRLDKEREG